MKSTEVEPKSLSPQVPEYSAMPAVTVSLIANYVKADLDDVLAFLGVAEMCGYELVRTHSYTRPDRTQNLE